MMQETKTKKSIGRIIGRTTARIAAVVLTFVVAVAATLLISLNMICSHTFPSAQQMFVTTILETGQLKFLASWFLDADEIQAIVDQNSMKELNAEVDADLIQIGGTSGSISVGGNEEQQPETVPQQDIENICFHYLTFPIQAYGQEAFALFRRPSRPQAPLYPPFPGPKVYFRECSASYPRNTDEARDRKIPFPGYR